MVKITALPALLLLCIASSVEACKGPKANKAIVDLISEFKGFKANIYT